jgi:hypothetical protein
MNGDDLQRNVDNIAEKLQMVSGEAATVASVHIFLITKLQDRVAELDQVVARLVAQTPVKRSILTRVRKLVRIGGGD